MANNQINLISGIASWDPTVGWTMSGAAVSGATKPYAGQGWIKTRILIAIGMDHV
jgi:hypothetical protein